MSAKRYKAGDMRRALQMVREDLGADAVILSSNRTDSGFEVIACADGEWRKVNGESAPPKPPAVAPALEAALAVKTPAVEVPHFMAEQRALADVQDEQRVALREELREELHLEMQELREWLETQWQPQLSLNNAGSDALQQKLAHIGLPVALHAQVLRDAPVAGDARMRWRALMAAMAARLIRLSGEDKNLCGHLALVGPSGAGKTTTLQKLAVRHALRYGNHQVGVISLDAERIGAHQALGVFCRMLDVPLKVAQDVDSLDLALRSLRNRSLVLIDIPGHHVASVGQQALFRLMGNIPDLQTYLTLPCTVQYPVMRAWWQGCRSLALRGLVLTKVDEASSLGEAIGLCLQSQLPLAWITDGPDVPNDLHDADPHKLLARAVELARAAEGGASRRSSVAMV